MEELPGNSRPWNIYTSLNPSPSQPVLDRDPPSTSSMNALSFGFVATAILISMFLIMAIFEHLFRPNPPFSSPEQVNGVSRGTITKFTDKQPVSSICTSDFSVVMPGQQYPTYIAKSAPLPCQREGVLWPSHEHNNFVFP